MARTACDGDWRTGFCLYAGTPANEEMDCGRLRAAHLDQVVRLSPALMALNVLSAGLVCVVHGLPWTPVMTVWLLALVGVVFLGMRAWWMWRGRDVQRVSVRTFHHGTKHSALLGAVWGAAAAIWVPEGAGLQMLLAAFITGMVGAGGIALAPMPWSSVAYVGTITLGVVVAMFRIGGWVNALIALLFIGYALVVLGAAFNNCRQMLLLRGSRDEVDRQREVVSLLLRDFEDNASDALWETNREGVLIRRSPRLEALFQAVGQPLDQVRFPHWLKEHSPEAAALLAAWALRRPFRDLKLQIGRGEGARWWQISARPVSESEPQRWRGVISDISDAHRFEDQLRQQAEQDALTGLPNRRSLLRAAQTALLQNQHGWMLSIDLDHFKLINDTSGHSVGDEVLREVARRLRKHVQGHDLPARLGGDEFALLCLSAEGDAPPLDRARAIIGDLSSAIHVGAKRLHVGASVGLSRLDTSIRSLEELLINADLALYDAKRVGRGRAVVYGPALGDASRRLSQIELALRGAFKAGQFHLHFQPKVDAKTMRPVAVEALMRWNHPKLGTVAPGEFISAAERCGMIHELGQLALREAALAAKQLDGLVVAVNVSPLQLMESDFTSIVASVLEEVGVEPSRIELEVTESVMLDDAREALRRLHALRELGVRVALDDFGTGYSSLAYLRSFPFDTLKIDRSFVQSLGEQANSHAIIDTIVQMARALGMRTVAEGVEGDIELAAVRAMHCDEVQGYLVSRPLSLGSLKSWLDGQHEGLVTDNIDSRLHPWWQGTVHSSLPGPA